MFSLQQQEQIEDVLRLETLRLRWWASRRTQVTRLLKRLATKQDELAVSQEWELGDVELLSKQIEAIREDLKLLAPIAPTDLS